MSSRIPGDADKTVYRYGFPYSLNYVPAAAFLAFAVILLLVPPPSAWQVLIVPLNLFLAYSSYRGAKVGAYFTPNDLKLARTYPTVRIPWRQVRRFVPGKNWRGVVAFAERTDGSRE